MTLIHVGSKTQVLRSLIFLSAAVCASGCASLGRYSPLHSLEQAIVFAPDRTSSESTTSDGVDVFIKTSDLITLHGRYFEHEKPRAVALFCHGNGGSVASWSTMARELSQRHQLSVLVFDYRGYGKSDGVPSESGILLDGQAAHDWLMQKANVGAADILLIGRSLGGAVAVDLAAERGAKGLVLQSTFSSLPDVAHAHMPWILPHLNLSHRLNSTKKIKRYHGPLLQSHGDKDEMIPMNVARRLFDAAPGKKEFVLIPHGGHNSQPGADYELVLDRFIDSLNQANTDAPAVKATMP